MAAPESVLMIVTPEAEALVKPFRDRFDPSAALGAPAHVTLLYPFLSPERIDEDVLGRLRDLFAQQAPIDYRFTSIRQFGEEVLYLAPEPDEPFRQMTVAIWRQFPETPPYAGKWPDIVPHLSVAWVQSPALLKEIAIEFRSAAETVMPISARATDVALFDNTSGRWQERKRFILGR